MNEKLIERFKSLDYNQKLLEIKVLVSFICKDQKKIDNFKLDAHGMHLRNAGAQFNNKQGNFNQLLRIHEDNKMILKEYIKHI